MTSQWSGFQIRGDARRGTERAADWVLLFSEGSPNERDRERFVSWLLDDPSNIEASLAALSVWQDLKSVSREGRFSTEKLVEDAKSQVVSQIPITRVHAAPPRRTLRRRLVQAAALVAGAGALAIGLFGSQFQEGHFEQALQTAVGQQQSVKLADGSIVHLNASSRLEVSFDNNQRLVQLESGEALFEVAHESSRPFRVRVRNVLVEAVGTRFNVHGRGASVDVAVIEGRILVESKSSGSHSAPTGSSMAARRTRYVRLSAGTQVRVNPSGEIKEMPAKEFQRISAWRDRKLAFSGDTLGEVVSEFNRYNTPPLRVEDPALSQLRISGVFLADAPESLIDFLSQTHDTTVRVDADGGRTIVIVRESPASERPLSKPPIDRK